MLKHSHQMFPRQIYHCWLLPKQSRELVSCFLGPSRGSTLLGVTGGLGAAPLPGFPRYSSQLQRRNINIENYASQQNISF